MRTSKNPAHPDADPTAPGGMSQKALADELIEKHGWSKTQIKSEFRYGKTWAQGSWPAMIDAVCEERRNRERDVLDEADDLLSHETLSLLIKVPGSYDYVFNGHAGAGPSSSDRWATCTESLRLSREFLETLNPLQQEEFAGASTAAQQGTTAHRVGEIKALELTGEMDSKEVEQEMDVLRALDSDIALTDEMEGFVTEYVDLISQYLHEDRDVRIESRVSASVLLTGSHDGEVYDITGTADVMVLPSDKDPVLVVGDLKYGAGVEVEVEANSQARIYALGALSELADDEGNLPDDLETVRYHIIQPRLGGIKTWEEALDDLLVWRDEVLAPALTAALYGEGAEFKPSEKACTFCPARGTCGALAADRVEKAKHLFDVVQEAEYETGEAPVVGSLSDADLGTLLEQINGLTDLQAALKDEAYRRALRGETVPGFKLVSYTPRSGWKEGAEKHLKKRKELWTKKLITPRQALLTMKGDEEQQALLEELIDRPLKKPVIAPAGDKRAEWTPTQDAENMFEKE